MVLAGRFVLVVLAAWRVTHLLAHEDGPADFLARTRQWLGSSFLGSLMDCFNCISIWVAAPLALYISHEPLGWLLVWLATSGAVCLLEKIGPEPVFIEQIPKLDEGEPDHGMLRPETRTDIESTNSIVENEPIH